MEKLAQPLVHQYLVANHLEPATVAASGPKLNTAPATAAKSPPAHPAAHSTTATTHHTTTTTTHHTTTPHHSATAPAAPTPLTFTDEQISGYTLSYGGLPTFVYSAALVTTGVPGGRSSSDGVVPGVPGGRSLSDGVVTDGPPVRVTLIAQRLPAGSLQVSLSSVTDEGHLDRTPWMRLVDAVDPDDSHRASLLFELRAKSSRQFALYSLASAEARQTFITGVIE
jgi:hypothetical protein